MQKTRAYHRLKDDVPDEVKIRRHEELKKIFREEAQKLNMAQIGQIQLILVEGVRTVFFLQYSFSCKVNIEIQHMIIIWQQFRFDY